MLGSAGLLGVIGIVFLIILAVLWFFLPFAVFGIQPKIEKVLAEMKRTNDLLFEIRSDIKRLGEQAAGRPSAVTAITCQQCHREHSDGSAACPFCGFRRQDG